ALDTASVFSVRSHSPARAPLSVLGSVSLDDARLDFLPSFAPPVGTIFTLIDNDGSDPVAGTFADLPEGARYKWSPSSPTARSGSAVVRVGPLAPGVHSIVASYQPDTDAYAPSMSAPVQLIVAAPAIATATTLSATPEQSRRGEAVTLTATVTSGSGTPAGSV